MPRAGGPPPCPLPPCPCPSHTSLPWQRQWAVPRLPSYPPPSPGSASGRSHGCAPPSPLSCGACGQSHGCNPAPPPLPKQRLWAIPRLHSFPLSSPAAPVGDPTAALPPSSPPTRPITPPAEWSSGQPHELLNGSRGFESHPSPRAPNSGNTV